MTDVILEALAASDSAGAAQQLVNGLTEDGRTEPNIEELLTRVRALRIVAGKADVRGLTGAQLAELERLASEKIVQLTDVTLPVDEDGYAGLALWVRDLERAIPVELFTTNYDLLLEQALEAHRIPYFDGFAGSLEPAFDIRAIEEDALPTRWARLWKVHGSINWREGGDGAVLRAARGAAEGGWIIHPSHLKYDEARRMPYLALIDRLRSFLKNPSAVLVSVGFSYGDIHLNEVIGQGLRANPSAAVFALIHGDLSGAPYAQALANAHPGITILARDAGVIAGAANDWRLPAGRAASSGAAEFLETGEASEGLPTQSRVLLGDFQAFGRFLRGMRGSEVMTTRAENGGVDA